MREDMDKVIVERPRCIRGCFHGTKGEIRKIQRIPPHEWSTRGSMRRRDKYPNENLAPLKRFLQSNIGRPWDKVYSEISANINRDNAVQAHIWTHVLQYVCIHTAHMDGRDVQSDGRRITADLYVDPRHGLLRVNKTPGYRWPFSVRRDERPVRFPPSGQPTRLGEVDGVWYEIETAALPRDGSPRYDAVLKKEIRLSQQWRSEAYLTYGGDDYAIRKRQLNKREIKRLVLRKQTSELPQIVR